MIPCDGASAQSQRGPHLLFYMAFEKGCAVKQTQKGFSISCNFLATPLNSKIPAGACPRCKVVDWLQALNWDVYWQFNRKLKWSDNQNFVANKDQFYCQHCFIEIIAAGVSQYPKQKLVELCPCEHLESGGMKTNVVLGSIGRAALRTWWKVPTAHWSEQNEAYALKACVSIATLIVLQLVLQPTTQHNVNAQHNVNKCFSHLHP